LQWRVGALVMMHLHLHQQLQLQPWWVECGVWVLAG
jgi:hypothetical protein